MVSLALITIIQTEG